ncbi:VOC family protein [Polaribacter vadi]|uniref:VOC family protein n=1 Tax=Polaribacter TaxID=52959 RepID=UPI001C0A2EB9|nr:MULTISPECIES: VOC family protein [Polaribacter]MBU3011278.1 VOC family protein [Polaribacter vadi]MDO6741091.1 VOC family protein [Polaribacter sp. 1_MG-2023]
MNLNQVTVPSLHVDKAIGFYQKLGLELIVKSLPNYARFVCPDGNATFSIHQVDELPKGVGVYVYFECEDLDDKVNEFIKKGIHFDELPNDKTWLWKEARLKDLDNNQIVLFFGGENRINPPWRIKK